MKKVRVASYIAAFVLACGVALLVWAWPDLKAQAAAGAAYGARMTCSCRYIQGRSMESCKGDMIESGMDMVRLDDDSDAKTVTGSVPLMARRTARLRQGFGCVLD
ncbi:hypothetical protein [Rhizorhapis sp. SPR117]|uniref:hypothetical protein n=1 Tax=Rhizorhapis sp. SPR117 TaxID=2912611 RepID=UPI001F38DA2F|nr:hypothetical protein [Rhizorhapis sp. SPR117]